MTDAQRERGSNLPAGMDLRTIIEAHGERLLRAAYLLCGNEAEAQDLV